MAIVYEATGAYLHFLHVLLHTQSLAREHFDLASSVSMVLYLEHVERASIMNVQIPIICINIHKRMSNPWL